MFAKLIALVVMFIMVHASICYSDDNGMNGKQVLEFNTNWRSNSEGGAQCMGQGNYSWSGQPLARVLFCTKESDNSTNKTTADDVYYKMATRDPGGWLNPYWITQRVATAYRGYDSAIEGTVVGLYYDRGFASWGTFNSMLNDELAKLYNIKWWGVTKGLCFDESTYREFLNNCTEVHQTAEAKDRIYNILEKEKSETASSGKVEKKPVKKKKAKKAS